MDKLLIKEHDSVGLITFGMPMEEAALGYTYTFPQLGLSFWRGNVCTEDDVEANWFNELAPDIQVDNKRFLYFETVTFQCQ